MSDSLYTEYLRSFGLSGQEAVVYQSLLGGGPSTGYEIAKACGLSRSNVYAALTGLTEKGAACLMEGTPARYVAVEAEAFCDRMLRELRRRADYLRDNAPVRRDDTDGYLTVRGSRHIRDTIRDMLASCEYRLYIMAEADLLREFEPELKRLIAEGKKVVLLTRGFAPEGAVVYETDPEPRQLRFITDSSHVLTGELSGSEQDCCLYSGQPNLVAVMKEALKNKITLIGLNLNNLNKEN